MFAVCLLTSLGKDMLASCKSPSTPPPTSSSLSDLTDINPADKEGFTPLNLAVGNDQSDVLLHLLQRGADPNRPDERGWTPLHWAAYCGFKGAIHK